MKLLVPFLLALAMPATAQVFEDLEHNNLGLYTMLGTNGSTSIGAASAHDGLLGVGFVSGTSPWLYRTDVSFGAGSVLRGFVHVGNSSGRTYVGFSADASGCWSAIIATNTSHLLLQENAGYNAYVNRAVFSYSFAPNTWYQLEVDWAANGDMTVNLYDEPGSTLLASTPTFASGQLAAKGFSIRGFDNSDRMDLDSLSLGGGVVPPVTYCTSKLTSNGCTPSIGSSGAASASTGSGFSVNGTSFINNKSCLLFYGVSGQSAIPFQGGFLCVKSPVKRTPGTNTMGAPPPNNCSGVPSIDMNLFAVGGLGGTPLAALLVPGTVVDCQWWGRDPGFVAPSNTMLSNGLEYTVGP
jgi:hypothetical protein